MHDFDYTGDSEGEGAEQFGAMEFGEGTEGEFEDEPQVGYEYDVGVGVLSPNEEMEMASDLLSANSEAELDQFLGKVFKRVAKGAGKFFKSGVGRALGGALRGIAKKAIPTLAGIAGNWFVPGIGGGIGRKLGSAAVKAFGLELEGLSPEDQEFEVAKRFVRLAADAANQALRAGETAANPVQIARQAVVAAARKHAPGLLAAGGATAARAGRWVRRGSTIVLFGA